MDFDFCEPILIDDNNDIDETQENTKKQSVSKIVNSIKTKVKKRKEIKIDIDEISFVDLSLEDSDSFDSKPQYRSEKNSIKGDELKQKLESIFNQLNSQEEDDLSQLAFAFSR